MTLDTLYKHITSKMPVNKKSNNLFCEYQNIQNILISANAKKYNFCISFHSILNLINFRHSILIFDHVDDAGENKNNK